MKTLILCAAVLGLTACSNSKNDSKAADKMVSFQCGDETVNVDFKSDKAVISYDGKSLEVPKVQAASGSKYELDGPDGYIMFWDNGNESSFEYGGQAFPPCLPM